MSSLHDDLEDCEEIEDDPYQMRTTTAARARLCAQCENYTIENRLMTSIRCKLAIRPSVKMDEVKKTWIASCNQFQAKDNSREHL